MRYYFSRFDDAAIAIFVQAMPPLLPLSPPRCAIISPLFLHLYALMLAFLRRLSPPPPLSLMRAFMIKEFRHYCFFRLSLLSIAVSSRHFFALFVTPPFIAHYFLRLF